MVLIVFVSANAFAEENDTRMIKTHIQSLFKGELNQFEDTVQSPTNSPTSRDNMPI